MNADTWFSMVFPGFLLLMAITYAAFALWLFSRDSATSPVPIRQLLRSRNPLAQWHLHLSLAHLLLTAAAFSFALARRTHDGAWLPLSVVLTAASLGIMIFAGVRRFRA